MSAPLISIAPDETGKSLREGPVLFHHRFCDHPLFSDAGLAGIIDGHPDDLTDLNINRFDADGRLVKLMTGDRKGQGGAAVLEAVSRGELWVNLRHVNETHPGLAGLMAEMHAGLVAHNKRFKSARLDTNLLISAPGAKVPYHADQPEVMLCHVRGAKRIWVYPNGGKHLPDEHFEKVVLKETTEDIPSDRSYDANAKVFDLKPGQAIAWPHNAPHRVENLGTVNVSLSIEYMTWDGRRRLGAYYVNGLLRRAGLPQKSVASLSPLGVAARWALSVPLKRLGLHKGRQMQFEREFELAPDAVEGVRQSA
jgi:hypothetical protein